MDWRITRVNMTKLFWFRSNVCVTPCFSLNMGICREPHLCWCRGFEVLCLDLWFLFMLLVGTQEIMKGSKRKQMPLSLLKYISKLCLIRSSCVDFSAIIFVILRLNCTLMTSSFRGFPKAFPKFVSASQCLTLGFAVDSGGTKHYCEVGTSHKKRSVGGGGGWGGALGLDSAVQALHLRESLRMRFMLPYRCIKVRKSKQCNVNVDWFFYAYTLKMCTSITEKCSLGCNGFKLSQSQMLLQIWWLYYAKLCTSTTSELKNVMIKWVEKSTGCSKGNEKEESTGCSKGIVKEESRGRAFRRGMRRRSRLSYSLSISLSNLLCVLFGFPFVWITP